MRRNFLNAFTILSFAFILFSCATHPNQTPAHIGLVPWKNYSLVSGPPVQDTAYLAIQNDTEFSGTFTGTEKLDLHGKTAVAIVLKNAASPQFDSADYSGSNVNIYAQSCSTAAQPQCTTSTVFLATIPKAGSAKPVHFFINNKRSAVNL